jgi:hypothetical protein
VREIAFSFDSFLDVVANVVGIIIRLILVVWVGARSYTSLMQTSETSSPPSPEIAAGTAALPSDPLQQEIDKHRAELAAMQARLLEQLRQADSLHSQEQSTQTQLEALSTRRLSVEKERQQIDQRIDQHQQAAARTVLSMTELRKRGEQLARELKALEQLPPVGKTLRYRTPVSRPVDSEELLFECRDGRVTFLDIAALLGDIKEVMEEKGKLLQKQWSVSDQTRTVGAFRLRYTISRERGLVDAVSGGQPDPNSNYRYALEEWEAVPVAPVRGETLEAALAETSEFRQIVDNLDPQHSVVTFWVYPDSFAIYRRLRDYLYDREVVVAGRPLPYGIPITCSRRGSVSRGQ